MSTMLSGSPLIAISAHSLLLKWDWPVWFSSVQISWIKQLAEKYLYISMDVHIQQHTKRHSIKIVGIKPQQHSSTIIT